MGEVIQKLKVKSSLKGKPLDFSLMFDSGSKETFVRFDVAKKLGNYVKLKEEYFFYGLGDGRFSCKLILPILVKIEGVWCVHTAWVADKSVMDDEILIGHDFMQKYDIKLDLKRRKMIADREYLKKTQRIRKSASSQ